MNKIDLFKNVSSRVSYDADTGKFIWLPKPDSMHGSVYFNSKFAGKIAGRVKNRGYIEICISINGKQYTIKAHQLAFYIANGFIHDGDIDHVNQIKHDNRACNLMAVTRSENLRNSTISTRNKSGVTGVCFASKAGKWLAQTTINGKNKQIGYFVNINDAIYAVEQARKNNGFSDRHGAAKK